MNHIKITVVGEAAEAPNYNTVGGFDAATLDECIVVRNGTESGRSTVDLVFHDSTGKKYVAMMTGRIMRSIADAIGDEG